MHNKEIYDLVYENVETYNQPPSIKDLYKYDRVDQFIFSNKHETILDVGCGVGHFLRRYHDQGLNITGVEISTVCCNKYLSGLKYYNMDVVDFANSTKERYDILYCFDVLEHIRPKYLESFILACKKLSGKCLFGICNQPSHALGIRLHLIRKGVIWWLDKIGQVFPNVVEIEPGSKSRYYVIKGEDSE